MKEKIKLLFYGILIIIIFSFAICNFNNYIVKGIVVEAKGNEIRVENKNGYNWNLNNSNFSVGDKVILIFNDNGTSNTATDDVLINIKKVK